jgi:SAM-dependent methyltransferase
MGFTNWVPWWARIGIKILLSRFPVGYRLWKRLGLFEHGDMNIPARALEIYLNHSKTAGFSFPVSENFSVLELGPGDSVFTALIAKAHGASRVWLVDGGSFATKNPKAYAAMAIHLHSRNYPLPFCSAFKSFQDVLDACGGIYLTDGSLKQIPDHSIDFCFSNAVLEHIPKQDFVGLTLEMRRVLKPNGVCVHRVDLKDHLGGGLNNLRFSEATWESDLFRRSGFYTNRIRLSSMLEIFSHAGFEYRLPRKICWDKLPVERARLAAEFQELPDDDLLVSGFDIILRVSAN